MGIKGLQILTSFGDQLNHVILNNVRRFEKKVGCDYANCKSIIYETNKLDQWLTTAHHNQLSNFQGCVEFWSHVQKRVLMNLSQFQKSLGSDHDINTRIEIICVIQGLYLELLYCEHSFKTQKC